MRKDRAEEEEGEPGRGGRSRGGAKLFFCSTVAPVGELGKYDLVVQVLAYTWMFALGPELIFEFLNQGPSLIYCVNPGARPKHAPTRTPLCTSTFLL